MASAVAAAAARLGAASRVHSSSNVTARCPNVPAGVRAALRTSLAVRAYRVDEASAAPPAADAPPAEEATFTAPAQPAVKAPTIDAKGFLAADKQAEPVPAEVARQIFEAGTSVGCFQLVNHGVSLDPIKRMNAAQRAFFALPLEEKLKVKRTLDNPNGFFNDEYTKQILDLKEGFDFVHEAQGGSSSILAAPNQWPASQPEFRRVMEAYLAEMSRVSFRLLEAFSIGMGLPPTTLHHLFADDHTSFMRLNYYPATSPLKPGMALNHHTGKPTAACRGQWNNVTPEPDALTINVGDQCQVLTNDVFTAPVHRVLSPKNGQARYSAPFFFNPRPDAVIEPLKEFICEERPAVYNPIPWAAFRQQRYAGDLADQGREIQIYHYKR
ncbi:hypothetical protein ABPG75_009441 [Micractinium tetrahymenae]